MSARAPFRVTLLGTGSPIPRADRFGPSTLIEAGDRKILIDAGRGATIRLAQLGIPIGQIDVLLLTHYHSDHTSGIPDFWLTGWLESDFGARQGPLRVIGPPGAKALMENLSRAYAADLDIRVADERLSRANAAIEVSEFTTDRLVYDSCGLQVIAFEVDHGALIKPAYGYRVEFDGRTVVISGDTRPNENVIRYGAGADLLIHEVAIARPELAAAPFIQRILAHHTTPHQAGEVFRRARPKLAVFTHLVFLASREVPPASVADLLAETRRAYAGPVVVGEDLMSFEVGELPPFDDAAVSDSARHPVRLERAS